MATTAEVKEQLKQKAELETSSAEAKPKTFREALLDPAQQLEIARAIPTGMTPERFTRLALTTINSTPLLQKCTWTSLIAGVMQAAALGLEPNSPLGHCWLLPFENRREQRFDVQFVLGYRGIINLALRSSSVLSVQAVEVYAGDEFEYELGLDEKLRHIPTFEEQQYEDIKVYYGIVRYSDGGHYWRLVKPHTIEEHRARSKSPDSPAWTNDKLAMSLKTVIRILTPYMPLSAEASAALAADGTAPTTFADVVTPTDDFLDVQSHEGDQPEAELPKEEPERCAECGDVDGAHQAECSKAPEPAKK